MKKLTKEQIERMSGLVNLVAFITLGNMVEEVGIDLIEEGFEKEDVLEFINIKVDQVFKCRLREV